MSTSDERYTFANGYMQRLFGLGAAEIAGRTLRQIHGEEAYARIAAPVRLALAGEPVSFEGEQDLAGAHLHLQTSYIPEVDLGGRVCGFFVLTFDITRLKQAEAQLEREARFDPLTGVGNRRQFDERLALAIARGRHQRVALALLFLDIDFLKPINDRHGHAAGDHLIRVFAQRLSGLVREGDLVARIGGDEFVVLSEHLEIADAAQFAERTAQRMIAAMAEPVVFDGTALQTGASIGIAVAGSPQDADTLIAAADRALYAAKAAGRNAWRRAD
jgi:diguanylate cyclase (GGDEF)-like protein/PAS domain S-box-containing protein